tara:strand:+ start:115 stop:459 length:345 start_codon:yes stop_codon:yes gene_type:complete
MPDWGTPFTVLFGRARSRLVCLVGLSFLLVGGEFVLTFQTKFKLELLDLRFQLLILRVQLPIPRSLAIDLTMQLQMKILIVTRQQHQMANGSTPGMRTMSNMGTAIFMFGVKRK